MTAPKLTIDPLLIQYACCAGVLVLLNYVLWAFGAPSWLTQTVVIGIIIIGILFVVQGKRYLPAVVTLLGLAIISLASPTRGWDAQLIWLFHAKRIFVEHSLYAQLDNYAPWSHNDYPLLIPSLMATLAQIAGGWNEIFPKLANVLVLFPALLCVMAPLKRAQPLTFCVIMVLLLNDQLINGYMDGVLACYYVAAGVLCYCLVSQECNTFPKQQWLLIHVLAWVVFTNLTLIKNEGVVLLLTLIGGAGIARMTLSSVRIPFAFIVVCFVSLLPITLWRILCHMHGVTNDMAQTTSLLRLSERFFSLDYYMIISTQWFSTIPFVLWAALLILALRCAKHHTNIYFWGGASILYIGILIGVYLGTPYDIEWHLRTSIKRVMLPPLLLVSYLIVFMEWGSYRLSLMQTLLGRPSPQSPERSASP